MTRVALRIRTTAAERALDRRLYEPILREAVQQVALLIERAWKRRAASGIFKKPTGRYAGSIAGRIFAGGLSAEVSPHVLYAEWLEVGARGTRIPATHRRSRFMGYHLARDTAQETAATSGELVQRVFERRIRDIAGA